MANNCNPSFGRCFQVISSNCVQYAGEDVPLLGITKGDTLTDVETIIIEKLLLALEGKGVDLSSITADCDFVANQLAGKDKTLAIFIQILVNSACTLKELIDDLDDQINTPITYDPGCLTPGTATTQGVLQAVVNELCDLKASIADISTTIQNNSLAETINNYAGTLMLSNITSSGGNGLIKTGSGATAKLHFNGMIPPFTPQFTYAPLSYFDSSGKGVVGTAFESFYICNGFNNTVDMRGYTPAGATNLPGINGPALQTVVDPVVANDPTIASNILERKGSPKVQLTAGEMPTHTHTTVLNSHTHNVSFYNTSVGEGFGVTVMSKTQQSIGNQGVDSITTSATGSASSTTGSAGGDQQHENRQPTLYGYFIVRLS